MRKHLQSRRSLRWAVPVQRLLRSQPRAGLSLKGQGYPPRCFAELNPGSIFTTHRRPRCCAVLSPDDNGRHEMPSGKPRPPPQRSDGERPASSYWTSPGIVFLRRRTADIGCQIWAGFGRWCLQILSSVAPIHAGCRLLPYCSVALGVTDHARNGSDMEPGQEPTPEPRLTNFGSTASRLEEMPCIGPMPTA